MKKNKPKTNEVWLFECRGTWQILKMYNQSNAYSLDCSFHNSKHSDGDCLGGLVNLGIDDIPIRRIKEAE